MSRFVDRLESRRLLSQSFVHYNHGHGGTIKIRGTNGNDTLDIAIDAGDSTKLNVTLNGVTQQFDVASVKVIDAKTQSGSDTLTIADNVLINAKLDGGKGDDNIKGGGGNDHIKGGGGVNTLAGGPGSDRFDGTDLDTMTDFNAAQGDVQKIKKFKPATLEIVGSDAPDTVLVTIAAGDPTKIDVTLNGVLTQYDLANYKKIEIKLLGEADNATVDPSVLLPVKFKMGDGDDTAQGGSGDDEFDGGAGADQFTGGLGADRFKIDLTDLITDFNAAEGDTQGAGSVDNSVDDSIDDSIDQDAIEFTGGDGPDIVRITLNPFDATLLDVSINGVTTSHLLANVKKIELKGGGGNDTLIVDPSVNIPAELEGGEGEDELGGGGGNDKIDGGNGIDQMTGGAGADHFINDATDDITDFNPGQGDTRDVAPVGGGGIPAPTGEEIIANGTSGDDTIYLIVDPGDSTRLQLIINDVSTFYTTANVTKIELNGGDGDDTIQMGLTITLPAKITGGAGADFLAGGGGNDTIDPGADKDQMYGNGGADAFINVEPGDTITDFNAGEGDTQTAALGFVVNSVLPSSPPIVTFAPVAMEVARTASAIQDPNDDSVRRVHG